MHYIPSRGSSQPEAKLYLRAALEFYFRGSLPDYFHRVTSLLRAKYAEHLSTRAQYSRDRFHIKKDRRNVFYLISFMRYSEFLILSFHIRLHSNAYLHISRFLLLFQQPLIFNSILCQSISNLQIRMQWISSTLPETEK